MSLEVSVIIPIYNRATMVGEAIASLQTQTLRNIEIIVVDDGSTDGSVDIVRAIPDPRIRLVEHGMNRGTPAARNSGLAAANGRYIAWLDSDDLARPERLTTQKAYLDANPSIAMIGAHAGTIRPNGRRGWLRRPRPTHHDQIAPMLLFRSPMLQSSIMGRSEILKQYPYSPDFPVAQDLDMFIRLTREHRVANLPEVLVDRRFHSGQVVRQQAAKIVDRKRVLFRDSFQRLGIDPSIEDLDRHIVLGRIKDSPVGRDFLDWSEQWLAGIVAANRSRRLYAPAGLDYAVRRIWQLACLASLRGPNHLHALTRFWSGPRVGTL